MAIAIKIRTHELAKDFDLPAKAIIEILAKYTKGKPKNTMSTLSPDEMAIVFDALTWACQVEKFDFLDDLAEKEKTAKETKKAPEISEEEFLKAVAEANAAPQKKQMVTVDLRSNTVDIEQFDTEKIEEELMSAKMTQESYAKKEKIISKGKQKENKRFVPIVVKEKPKRGHIEIEVPDEISVGDFAYRLKRTAGEVVKELMKMGVMASISQLIDYDTAAVVGMELGATVNREINVSLEEQLINDEPDNENDLQPRSPVVVVMGHVDHGKTSLLDTIRNTNVISGEAGGITQHIGAYRVRLGKNKITFLDTPGHEAFTAMRARGAQATDIAILVVAADDGIMPQTIEAINHAKDAGVHIIVAINKIDKEGANPDRVMQELTEYGLVPEAWGGDTICVNISAKQNINIDKLLEMVVLTADMKELKANPKRQAKGVVIESRLDKGKGPIATLLVQNGTLKIGDVIIAGTAVGRIRAMMNEAGKDVKSAAPSVPVEVLGFSETPEGGDLFYVVDDERKARQVADIRKHRAKIETEKAKKKVVSLDGLFEQLKEGEIKDLNLIVKGDVQGSVEAMVTSLEKLTNDDVRVRIVHASVGAVNDSDVMLANASNAVIIGFNVRPLANVADNAEKAGVDIRLYRVIYQAIEEVEAAMKGMLDPEFEEKIIGHAEVRQTFKASGVGTIAGCYVTDGKITRGTQVRLVRDGIVVYEGDLTSLKRFKDDAKEVLTNFECGITLEKFNDIKEGDVLECYEMVEKPR